MALTTRDLQRERRNSQLYATAVLAASRRSSLTGGIDNQSFLSSSVTDVRTTHLPVPATTGHVDIAEEQEPPNSPAPHQNSRRHRYHWKMSHYFYIHISLFIVNGLLGGLIVWLIENYSSARNRLMAVPYVDAWFMSSTCVYNCGLTTIDFAQLSHASQIVLMVLTFISGITISTLPALVVKAHTHRRVEGITVDDDHGELDEDNDNELPTLNPRRSRNLPPHIRSRLATLPNAAQLRYRAYVTCIVLILATCFTIYTITFVAIGSWLQGQYTPEYLMQNNATVNPWYASFIITITGFNQNGLTPFSSGFALFVNDVFLNLFTMLIVMSGTSLFPFLLRNVVLLSRLLAPWRHKIIFDYILMNNHRLSTLLFPSLQTRIYLLVTILLYIMGVGISLILDLHSEPLSIYSSGTRVLIFFFQTVNSRFAGFQSVDLNTFATATLVVYLLLMATKPQMLCALDESPFELSWLALQAQEEVDAQTNSTEPLMPTSISPAHIRSISFSSVHNNDVLPLRHMKRFLHRQSMVTKDRAREQFSRNAEQGQNNRHKPKKLTALRRRLFFIYLIRALLKHTFSFVILTRTWLFVFIFLICAIEYRQMAPIKPDSDITIFKIIFEIISAFGAVGFSLGAPNVASSFASILSPASKIILVITMLMGRHRGLLASMKDQEAIEHSAADLINRRCEEVIEKFERSNANNDQNIEQIIPESVRSKVSNDQNMEEMFETKIVRF